MKKNDIEDNVNLYNVEPVNECKKKKSKGKRKKKNNKKIFFYIIIISLTISIILCLIKLIIIIVFHRTKIIEKQNLGRHNTNQNLEKNNIPEKINLTDDGPRWKKEKLIMHALGEVNNSTYINSYEGLNYYHTVKNMNLMEADFLLTKDNHLVVAHDYGVFDDETPTLDQFKSSKTRGNQTPMTFEDLVKYMNNNRDLYIITDTKYTDFSYIEREFNEMEKILSKYGDVNERFIIEIYNEKMYEFLKEKKYPFKYFLFTLYRRLPNLFVYTDLLLIFEFCKENKIDGIIIQSYWFDSPIIEFSKKYSIPVYLYTSNDIKTTVDLLNSGVKAVMTDNLTNDILEKFLKR